MTKEESSWSSGSWIYNYLCNQCLSPLKLWIWTLYMARCNHYCVIKFVKELLQGRWFSQVSSNNKTECHDITEILLKVGLNTITLTLKLRMGNLNIIKASQKKIMFNIRLWVLDYIHYIIVLLFQDVFTLEVVEI